MSTIYLDLGLHCTIAAYLDQSDLDVYISTFKLNDLDFWSTLTQVKFPWNPWKFDLKCEYKPKDIHNAISWIEQEYSDKLTMILKYKSARKAVLENIKKRSQNKSPTARSINPLLYEMFPEFKGYDFTNNSSYIPGLLTPDRYLGAEYLIISGQFKLTDEYIKDILHGTSRITTKLIEYILDTYQISIDIANLAFTNLLLSQPIELLERFTLIAIGTTESELCNFRSDVLNYLITVVRGNNRKLLNGYKVTPEKFDYAIRMTNIIEDDEFMLDRLMDIPNDNPELIKHLVNKLPMNISQDLLTDVIENMDDMGLQDYTCSNEFKLKLLREKFGL